MIDVGYWLLAGVAIGMILMAFLAIGTYQRGYAEGYFLRRPWRAEFEARRSAVIRANARTTAFAASRYVPEAPAELMHRVAANG